MKNGNKELSIMKDGKIKAVHDNDLLELLKSLGIYDSIVQDDFKCYFCGDDITINNIASIIPNNKDISISCTKKECYRKLIRIGEIN